MTIEKWKSGKFLSFGLIIGQGLRLNKLYFYHLAILISLKDFYISIRDKKLNLNPLYFYFGLWPFISLAWSPTLKLGLLEAIQILMGLYFLVLPQKTDEMKRPFLFGLWINIVISLLECFHVFKYPLSMDWPAVERGWLAIPSGLHWNPNTNAFFILITSPLLFRFHSLKWRWLYLVVATIVIFASSSKLILIAWILILMIFLYRDLKADRTRVVLSFSFLFLGLSLGIYSLPKNSILKQKYSKVLSVVHFVEIMPGFIWSRIQGKDFSFNLDADYNDSSLHERSLYFDGLIVTIIKKPWLGHGAGALKEIVHTQQHMTRTLQSPHFYFLELWAKYGLFYFVIYLLFIFKMLKKLFQKDKFYFLSLLLFTVCNPVISSAIYFLPKWFLYKISLNKIDNL